MDRGSSTASPPGSDLYARRTTVHFVQTLLKKNYLLKKRHPVATLLEIFVPCLFIIVLGVLKLLVKDVDVPAGWSTDSGSPSDGSIGTSSNLFTPDGPPLPWLKINLPQYYNHEATLTGLLLSLGTQSIADGLRLNELSDSNLTACTAGIVGGGAVSTDASSPFAVPSQCQGRVVPYKLAMAPDTPFTRDYFMQTMEGWYPRISLMNGTFQVPSLNDSVHFFSTADALEEYIKSDEYGKDMNHPKIYGGIVFDQHPREDQIGTFTSIEYTVRMNSTDDVGQMPSTGGNPMPVDLFQKDIDTDASRAYSLGGFMTLQTLVTRFVTCMPEWDVDSKMTTGECQRAQATAQSSDELNARLLATMDDDARLQYAMWAMASQGLLSLDDETNTGSAQLLTAGFPFSTVLSMSSDEDREALLRPLRQVPQPYLGATLAPFPVSSFVSSPFYDAIADVVGILFILSYLYTMSRMLVVFIDEKETRMREFMKILGVQERAIIIAWYITYTVMVFVGAVLQTIAGPIGFFANSSSLMVFLFFFTFGLSVLAFAFLVSTLFSKARTGAFVGMILFFIMYFISVGFSVSSSENAKTVSCLLPPVALTFGLQVLSDLESSGEGVNLSNASTLNGNFRFTTSVIFFVIDTVLFTLVGLYLEKVIPKDYGTTLPWYFPFSVPYWRGRREEKKKAKAPRSRARDEGLPSPVPTPADTVAVDVNPNIESLTAELRDQESNGEALSVQRLRKVFAVPGGEKVAVKGMNLSMHKDQITCLLGHNGAGKTTLISLLTGMMSPSSGDATFRGLSFSHDMDEIRESLGICFQHDVLFPEVTVEEHLLFFARIKGYSGEALAVVVDRQIREVGLTEKRHVRSSELSGGMKRKLSVAISLLGDSLLVFLDEPTSGMDPYSRRSTWEILLNNRVGRVMVLTTHLMDEADILGDRIAIMAEGELRCCGSSLFLKNLYGAGYNLTLVKDDHRCNDSDLMNTITNHVASAQVLSNVGSEIAFQLPIESSHKFASMFAELDANMNALGLLSYGVSMTTLEEVFIKVAEAGDEHNQHTLNKGERIKDDAMLRSQSLPVLGDATGSSMVDTSVVENLFMAHLQALLLKRFRVAKRDVRMMIFSVALPVLLLLIGLVFLRASGLTNNDPLVALSTDAYGSELVPTPYFCQADGEQWCSSVMDPTRYTGASPHALELEEYDSSQPTVFGVKYTDPTINVSDATGYELKLGEEVFKRGYGQGQDTVAKQYGAYLVYGDSASHIFGYNTLVNTTSIHAGPIFKAVMDQAVYRFFAGDTGSDSQDINLKVNAYPLPLTASEKAMFTSFIAFSACIFVAIAFTFFPASIVVFLVKEKDASHNAKHQQLVSGVSLPAFWLANYIWDLIMYIVPCVSALALIQLFSISSLTGRDCDTCSSSTFPAVVLLFVLFGLAICPFTYCVSHLFHDYSSAQTYAIVINFIIGVVLMIISFVLDIISSTEDINAVLVFVWRLSPLFNLGNGLLSLARNDIRSIEDSKTEINSPFSGDLMGFELLYLALQAIGFSIATVAIDYAQTFPRVKKKNSSNGNSELNGEHVAMNEDEDDEHELDIDVLNEVQRVETENGFGDDVVVLKNLRKVYNGGKVAVRGLTFGLKRGDCFGFLGINGAGKTSTMKMLTGDVPPTAGTAALCGYDILTQQLDVRRQIGYCPQFDSIFELMTVREHLELFARIKGVSRGELDAVVSGKIQQLNLSDFEDKLAGSLSGGNKRKLSVAIAMIGTPKIIFLDEPSTGMDPVSRRFMWDVIAGISTRSQSATIVLTTHSMEECEALCSRVGIMVGGRLTCLGSVQHLKSRFGDGLVFDVKMAAPSREEVKDLVTRHFENEHRNPVVMRMELDEVCAALGNEALAQRVVPSHPTGYALAAAMDRDGFVRPSAFVSWMLEEAQFDSLSSFLQHSFGEHNVRVMERQNEFCRFKLRGSNEQLKLSRVFNSIEQVKDSMHIQEYSVSQTTLEQIFNAFASKQSEEQGVARGMVPEE